MHVPVWGCAGHASLIRPPLILHRPGVLGAGYQYYLSQLRLMIHASRELQRRCQWVFDCCLPLGQLTEIRAEAEAGTKSVWQHLWAVEYVENAHYHFFLPSQ